jgi:hypothetical protein
MAAIINPKTAMNGPRAAIHLVLFAISNFLSTGRKLSAQKRRFYPIPVRVPAADRKRGEPMAAGSRDYLPVSVLRAVQLIIVGLAGLGYPPVADPYRQHQR